MGRGRERGRPVKGTPRAGSRILRALALDQGFGPVGIAAATPSDHGAFLTRWLEAGYHGSMGYLSDPGALSRRLDLRRTFPEVRTVLVVAHPYDQPDPGGVPGDPERGVIARYARGRDYHRVIRGKLRRLHQRFEDEVGESVSARAYVDTGPLLERELGQRAGLGWFGRNTMLIHPRRGSYFFLGALLLSVDLETDPPFERDHCGSCHSCLEACPTGALLGRDPDGAPLMDARRCISYLTIENRGPIPRELRPRMGNRVYGCDICQEVCPFTSGFSEISWEPSYAARGPGERPAKVEPDHSQPDVWHPGTDAPPLTELLAMALSEATWEAFSRGSAIRRAGRAGFARNVSVALGNWLSGVDHPPEEAVAVLGRALFDPERLVRGHAAWALGQVGSVAAAEALKSLLESEGDPWVREEAALALEG